MNDLQTKVFEAGVVGCGGAGFPTHIKLSAKADYLIVNGAECEPLLRTDRHIMLKYAKEVVEAALYAKSSLGNPIVKIALKDTYKNEIGSLKAAIAQLGADVELCLLTSFYPAGDEQAVVYEASGRVVPAGGIPLDVGCVVINVATLYNVFKAQNGQPFTQKILTVTGAVKHPAVVSVPLGTPFKECIAHVGGTTTKNYIVVSGGPIMGKRMSKEQAANEFVTKTTSGIIVLAESEKFKPSWEHLRNRAKCSCIQCTYCTELCPRFLLGNPIEPHKIMRALAFSNDVDELLASPVAKDALLCCECGVCELYACPMGLLPREVNVFIKKELTKRGIRHPKSGAKGVSDFREDRKVPSKRIAARIDVLPYYDACDAAICKEYGASRVELLLKQHIGAPSVAVVKSGDYVKEGQKIAIAAEGAPSANLHASISGVVEVRPDRIIIMGE